jgi:phosphoribosylamine--glycine ligase
MKTGEKRAKLLRAELGRTAMRPITVVAMCKSGRLDAIAEALRNSASPVILYILSEVNNPGLEAKAKEVIHPVKTDNPAEVAKIVRKINPDFVLIGPEEPLATGVVDELLKFGIPCVGPTQKLAQLETSKSFTRKLLTKHNIPGNPKYRVFRGLEGIADHLRTMDSFVVKPDGLTGGKGVKVFGEQIHSIAEAVKYCAEIFESGQPAVVIEEKLDGEEFSFQSFFDGKHIVHTIPVQDHKRARDGDTGPNTGGMGSYSCADHLLPFLTRTHVQQAGEINRLVGEAVSQEIGEDYKGILYGGFMLTKDGLRVIEYNARFGDPEVMNVLPLMQADFVEVCKAIIDGTLDKLTVRFRHQATVCKYVVPKAYPQKSAGGNEEIKLDAAMKVPGLGDRLRMYWAAVGKEGGKLYLTGSRAVAFVGIANTLFEAEKIAEEAASLVEGPVFHRRDIGTAELIQKRVDHMHRIVGEPGVIASRVSSIRSISTLRDTAL